jgi:TM2 domain-containing membrane protein YozV
MRDSPLPEKCPECGGEMSDTLAEKCPLCGALIEKKEKSPGMAAILSLIFTGSGQVYNGDFIKGILVLLGSLIGALFFLIPGLIVWIYGIYDAYTTSKKMNEGIIPYRETTLVNVLLYIAAWIVLVIIIVTVALALETFAFLGL